MPIVPREKLESYLLDPQHDVGRHKARVFASALGIRQRDWEYLGGPNDETRRRMTVWLIESDIDPPRIVTAYVVGEAPGA